MLNFNEKNFEFTRTPFLISLTDSQDCTLKIVISPALVNPDRSSVETGNNTLDILLANASSIMPNDKILYEIEFENYILYRCITESYADDYLQDAQNGIYFYQTDKSDFLENVKNTTFAQQIFFNNEIKHYAFYTIDHVIDVASPYEPTINRILRK